MHAKLQLIPTYFSIGNEILIMTTNARAILSGGVGKNGSSVAVSLMHPFLSIGGEASFSSAFFLVLEYWQIFYELKGTSILSPSTPIVLSVASSLTIYFKSTSNVFEEHISLYLITFGLVTAKLTCKLVVSQSRHLSPSPSKRFVCSKGGSNEQKWNTETWLSLHRPVHPIYQPILQYISQRIRSPMGRFSKCHLVIACHHFTGCQLTKQLLYHPNRSTL